MLTSRRSPLDRLHADPALGAVIASGLVLAALHLVWFARFRANGFTDYEEGATSRRSRPRWPRRPAVWRSPRS